MRSINSPFKEIPDFFRRDIYSQILTSSKKLENVQFIGLRGFGKSLTLRLLESNQDKIKKQLKADQNTLVYLCDLSLLSDYSTNQVLKHIFAKMIGFEKLQSIDAANLSYELQKYFDSVKKEGKKIIIVLDSLEKLESYHNLEVFNFLNALYKQNMDFMSYVFCFEHEVGAERAKAEFGDLGRLMFNKVLYLTPLDSKEEDWFFDAIVKMIPDVNIQKETKKLILESAGGYLVTIKRLIETVVSGEKARDIIENPNKFAGLAYNFDMLLDDLNSNEMEALKKVVDGKSGETNLAYLSKLREHYLINEKNIFLNKVLENYLKSKFGTKNNTFSEKVGDLTIDAKLTASEYKILEFLNKRKGNICTREEIIEAVWGERADRGISDHALDQIVSRLRKKVASSGSNLSIETLRGRGHRLI